MKRPLSKPCSHRGVINGEPACPADRFHLALKIIFLTDETFMPSNVDAQGMLKKPPHLVPEWRQVYILLSYTLINK